LFRPPYGAPHSVDRGKQFLNDRTGFRDRPLKGAHGICTIGMPGMLDHLGCPRHSVSADPACCSFERMGSGRYRLRGPVLDARQGKASLSTEQRQHLALESAVS
jgi:hypothetical protein